MPDCKICQIGLAFTVWGAICPNCKARYTIKQVIALPGYNEKVMADYAELFAMLSAAGLLAGGINVVDIVEDGLVIQRENEL